MKMKQLEKAIEIKNKLDAINKDLKDYTELAEKILNGKFKIEFGFYLLDETKKVEPITITSLKDVLEYTTKVAEKDENEFTRFISDKEALKLIDSMISSKTKEKNDLIKSLNKLGVS